LLYLLDTQDFCLLRERAMMGLDAEDTRYTAPQSSQFLPGYVVLNE
jgi:hypothetical protein